MTHQALFYSSCPIQAEPASCLKRQVGAGMRVSHSASLIFQRLPGQQALDQVPGCLWLIRAQSSITGAGQTRAYQTRRRAGKLRYCRISERALQRSSGDQCTSSSYADAPCLYLIWVHRLQHRKNQLSGWSKQSLFNVCSPPDCGGFVLWDSSLHVPEALCCRFSGNRQIYGFGIWWVNPHVESYHL